MVDIISEVTTVEVVHQQIQIISILKGALHVYNEIAVTLQHLRQNLTFVDDRLNAFLGYHSGFVNDFEGINFFSLFISDFPDTPKAAFANDANEVEH